MIRTRHPLEIGGEFNRAASSASLPEDEGKQPCGEGRSVIIGQRLAMPELAGYEPRWQESSRGFVIPFADENTVTKVGRTVLTRGVNSPRRTQLRARSRRRLKTSALLQTRTDSEPYVRGPIVKSFHNEEAQERCGNHSHSVNCNSAH